MPLHQNVIRSLEQWRALDSSNSISRSTRSPKCPTFKTYLHSSGSALRSFWNMNLFLEYGPFWNMNLKVNFWHLVLVQDILAKLGKCESYFWNYDSLTGWFNYCIKKSELKLKEEEILIWNETFSDQGSNLRQLSLCQFSSLPRSPTPTLSYLFIPILFIFS